MTKAEIEERYKLVAEPKAPFAKVWEQLNGPGEDSADDFDTGVTPPEPNLAPTLGKLRMLSNKVRGDGDYDKNRNEYSKLNQLKRYSREYKKYGTSVPRDLIDSGEMDWQGNIL